MERDTYEISLNSDSSVLFDAFTVEAQAAVEKGTSVSTKSQKPSPREQAILGAHYDEKGFLFAPQTWIQGTMHGAMGFIKIGRKSGSRFTGAVKIPGDKFYFMRNGKRIHVDDTEVDTRAHNVQLPNGKQGKKIKHRLLINEGWTLQFPATFITEHLDVNVIRQILGIAGTLQGIGSFRPEHKGPFGTFSPTRIEFKSRCNTAQSCVIISGPPPTKTAMPPAAEKTPAKRKKAA